MRADGSNNNTAPRRAIKLHQIPTPSESSLSEFWFVPIKWISKEIEKFDLWKILT